MEYTEATRPPASPRRIVCPVVQYTDRPPALLRNLCPAFSHKPSVMHIHTSSRSDTGSLFRVLREMIQLSHGPEDCLTCVYVLISNNPSSAILRKTFLFNQQPCPWVWKILMRNVQWCTERQGQEISPSLTYISDVTLHSVFIFKRWKRLHYLMWKRLRSPNTMLPVQQICTIKKTGIG